MTIQLQNSNQEIISKQDSGDKRSAGFGKYYVPDSKD
jgi:hypothetical protein